MALINILLTINFQRIVFNLKNGYAENQKKAVFGSGKPGTINLRAYSSSPIIAVSHKVLNQGHGFALPSLGSHP